MWKKNATVKVEIFFWCIKFSIPEIFWNTEGLHDEVYRYYETQKESEQPVMLPRPIMRESFRYENFLESEKDYDTIFYGTMRRKTFDRKSWYPHIMHEFCSIPENFWNTEVLPNVFFHHCETKFFDKTLMRSPSYLRYFPISNFFEIPMCSLKNFFGTVILFVFDGKLR